MDSHAMASPPHRSLTENPVILAAAAARRPTWQRAYQLTLVVSDALMLLLAFAVAYLVRFYSDIPIFRAGVSSVEHYAWLVFTLIPIWLALFALLQLYDLQFLLSGTGEYARALNGCTSGMMLVVVISFIIPEFVIARGWLVLAWLLSSLFICSARWCLRRLAHTLRRRGWFLTPAVIVGTNAEALSIAPQLCASRYSGLTVLGFVEAEPGSATGLNAQPIFGLPILGTVEELPRLIQTHGIEEVIVAPTALSRNQLLQTTLRLSSMPAVKMSLSSGLYEIFTTRMQVSTRNAVSLMSLNRMRLEPLEMVLKLLLDYTIVLTALFTLLPLLLLIALWIKLDSPGPVLYRRRVLGMGGKPFDAFKFRTMFINGDAILAGQPALLAELCTNHKLKADPRITRAGRWLRRTSLDEVPQVLNVLLGQMSLVGPRMITPEEAAHYGRMCQNLLTVRPGLTGLWQVSGRADLAYEERVRLDMHYIRNYSLWLDLQILFLQTPIAVIKGRGAY